MYPSNETYACAACSAGKTAVVTHRINETCPTDGCYHCGVCGEKHAAIACPNASVRWPQITGAGITGAVVGIDEDHVNHPSHYGGADNPYEAIKVIEAWGLGFCLGNALKYICRAGKKTQPVLLDVSSHESGTQHVRLTPDEDGTIEDLEKAAWYLNREIERLKKEHA